MNAWFTELDAAAQRSIGPRFVNKRPSVHWGAFFELYLHALVRRGGYVAFDFDTGRERHEDRRPDFLLTCPRGTECWLEATVERGDDVVPPAGRPRAQQMRDALDKLRNRSYLLAVDLVSTGVGNPPRRLRTEIDRWLDSLVARATSDPQTHCFQLDDWRLEIQAIPRGDGAENERDPGVVGCWTEGGGEHMHVFSGERRIEFRGPRPLRDRSMLKDALKAKRDHRYELGGRPFVIALLCRGDFVTDRDIVHALVGGDGLWARDRTAQTPFRACSPSRDCRRWRSRRSSRRSGRTLTPRIPFPTRASRGVASPSTAKGKDPRRRRPERRLACSACPLGSRPVERRRLRRCARPCLGRTRWPRCPTRPVYSVSMPAPKNHSKDWTTGDVAQLKRELKQNTPTRLVGLHLGRTPEAVQSKANALGLSTKPVNQSPRPGKKKS